MSGRRRWVRLLSGEYALNDTGAFSPLLGDRDSNFFDHDQINRDLNFFDNDQINRDSNFLMMIKKSELFFLIFPVPLIGCGMKVLYSS